MKKCKVTFEFEIKDGDLWDWSLPEIRQNLFDIFLGTKADLMMKIIEINPKESKAMRVATERAIAEKIHALNGLLETFQVEITEEKGM